MRGKKITSALTAFALLSSSAMADVSYTVQKGDSYWNIAKRFNTSMQAVMDANPESASSYLIAGQIIKI